MATGSYLSIIILNVNGLNAPINKDWLKGYKNKTPIYALYKRPSNSQQDKPKVKHSKTNINQINEHQTQRANIKSSKGKNKINAQGDSHKDNS